MATASFSQGQAFLLDGLEYVIDQHLGEGEVQVRQVKSGRISQMPQSELELKYGDGSFRFVVPESVSKAQALDRPVTSFEGKDWDVAQKRLDYVLASLDIPGTKDKLIPAIQGVKAEKGYLGSAPHWVTVVNWRKKYLNSGKSLRALLPRHDRCGRLLKEWDSKVLNLVYQAIKEKCLIREYESYGAAYQYACDLVEAHNKNFENQAYKLPLPTMHLFRRLFDEIPFDKKMKERKGQFYARTQTRYVSGAAQYGEDAITDGLVRAEIDYKTLDIIIADTETGIPLIRPTATALVDTGTGASLWTHVSLAGPSWAVAAECLRRGMMSKGNLSKDYPEIKNPWIPHGIMQELITDNALEFHGTSIEKALLDLNVTLTPARSKAGEDKPHVENFLKLLDNHITRGIPGHTFKDPKQRGDLRSHEVAVITLKEIRSRALRYSNDVYQQRPMRYKASPLRRWNQTVNPEDILVPADPEEFKVMMGTSMSLTLNHHGVQIKGIFYHADEFPSLIRRYKKMKNGEPEAAGIRVEARINEEDLGTIHVVLPEDRGYVVATAKDFAYANGKSMALHNVLRAETRKRNKEDNTGGWRETLSDLQFEAAEFRKRKRRRTSKRDRKEAFEHASKAAAGMEIPDGAVAHEAATPEDNGPEAGNLATDKGVPPVVPVFDVEDESVAVTFEIPEFLSEVHSNG